MAHSRTPTQTTFAALLLAAACGAASAQSNDDMNAANNPLTPTIGLNLQNQYTGRYYGLGDADGNAADTV